jgi:hypothetical protein
MAAPPPGATLARLRAGLLGMLGFGILGTGLELLLIPHTEDAWQIVPLALFGIALGVMLWHAVAPRRASVRALQAVMVAFLASGGLGLWFHYTGNVEFELEMHAGAEGWELFKAALAGATPALAPGTMILLGLLGLGHTWRHPALDQGAAAATQTTES